MAENETTAVAEKEAEFQYPITIEDVGPGAKKVSVEIPREQIDKKLAEQFKELRQQAAIPGFRTGHAPQKLIEKRFSHDVKEQVRSTLIQESYKQALEKNSLQVIGEPEFADPDAIKLPDEGSLSYSFQVEVQPDFQLPPLTGLKIRKPKIDLTDANVDQAMINLRTQQGILVPIEDRGVESGDFIHADVHLKVGDEVVSHQHNAQLVARPGKLAGLQIDDLDKQIGGLKPGETRTFTIQAPEEAVLEAVRGKEVQVEVALKDIKKMELAEVNEAFLADLGFATEQELRDALREQMDEKIKEDVQRAMRDQVTQYLLDNVHIELPAKLSDRQAERVASRRMIDSMMRGAPRDEVTAQSEKFRSAARDEAIRDLKVFFILQKLAATQNVDIEEPELNGRIAMIAAESDRRPEKLKQDMAKDGTLTELYVQMREQRAIDKLLETANIEEVDVSAAS
jgi:trigger factor